MRAAAIALLIVAAGLLGRAAAAEALPCAAAHWVGSWEAAPGDGIGGFSGAFGAEAVPDSGHDDVFELLGGTFRVILTPHLGGGQVRVRLSNRFGTQPLSVNDATIALAGSGPALVPGSVRSLTVAGSSVFVIAAGQDLITDPVSLSVSPFQNLAVSLDVPAPLSQITEHLIGRQISYFASGAAGDQAPAVAGAAFSVQTTARPFVAGVDVLAAGSVGAVVALGDSITDGYAGQPGVTLGNLLGVREDPSGVGANSRWPDLLARRLIAANRPLSVLNAGISGNRVLYDGGYGSAPIFAVYGPAALSRLQPDVLAQAGVSDAIVLEGINDIGQPPNASAAQLIGGLTQLVARIHGAGVAVQLGTLTPFSYATAAEELTRGQVNTWIRTQHLSDGIVDFDQAVRDPADPRRLLPAYDSGDHLHPSAAGYGAMADAIGLAALRGPACAAATAPARHGTRPVRRKVARRHRRAKKRTASPKTRNRSLQPAAAVGAVAVRVWLLFDYVAECAGLQQWSTVPRLDRPCGDRASRRRQTARYL
jgi:lysophospholipase L1-like esterase